MPVKLEVEGLDSFGDGTGTLEVSEFRHVYSPPAVSHFWGPIQTAVCLLSATTHQKLAACLV